MAKAFDSHALSEALPRMALRNFAKATRLDVGVERDLGDRVLDDVRDHAGADLILSDAACFHGLGRAKCRSSGLQLTSPAGDTLYQAVLIVEGILDRHAFHPVA